MAQWGDLSWRTRTKPNPRAFTPYNPTVPTGSYDPGLDSALYAAQRGLGDVETDTATARQRGLVDYGLGRDSIIQGRDRRLADDDLAQGRGFQDYNRNVQLLENQFALLGNRQRQQATMQGVVHGGSLLQAKAKRATNQAVAREPLDKSWSRTVEDLNTDRARVTQDATSQLGQLGLAFDRGDNDAISALTRARREAGQFGIDTQTQKLFQASQAGYVAPPRPSNEFTRPDGTVYRTIMVGGKKVRVDQYGRRI